ncbi:MAG: beta-glucosidase [Nocardioidaceae bacterium]|nr:beta-glucosidase [Nocardioidaceae bacterium]NUS51191.1 beta-glucosidase [Nocardioidaceae bacterium]
MTASTTAVPDVASARELGLLLPPGFELGVATASYQIEGAVDEGGRGPSIWDTFSHTPGKVARGETGDVACDHYHRYREDVALMRDLGVDAYRLSVAWPRVQPDGRGAVNPDGLAFYERLVDELLEHGITPLVTLYHWDLPQPLEDDGGWRNRDTAQRFADYARIVQDALGDRVSRWITLNEPYCSSVLGYGTGRHAPGVKDTHAALSTAHHLLLGHGLAVAAMREADPDASYGITLNLEPAQPVSDREADVEAARRSELLSNRIFTDPVLRGTYPDDAREVWGEASDLGFLRDGDLAVTSAPLDFLGVNYYFPARIKAVPHEEPAPALRRVDDLGALPLMLADDDVTEMGWPVDADGIRRLLVWLHRTYPGLPPVYITENGRACADVPEGDVVDDRDRIGYLDGHLRGVVAATEGGVDVRGYYVWSLLDNFEWAAGYARRFGLVHVDYDTQRRLPKASYHWYREVIAARAN